MLPVCIHNLVHLTCETSGVVHDHNQLESVSMEVPDTKDTLYLTR